MGKVGPPGIARWFSAAALAVLVVLAGLLASCGSSGGSVAAASPAAKSACAQVGGALSDGPDPGADPVGYAFAQIRPLRAIKVPSDTSLQGAIDTLASAYQRFYDAAGSHAATKVVDRAAKTINALCSGTGAGV